MLTQAPRGTRDVLPTESYKWQYLEEKMRKAAALAGYREVRTPVFEHTELFARGVGDTTDIVQKEMYTFEDKGHRSVTLKPEGTAGAVRCFLESGLYADALPCKMYYLDAPIFRYEAPQSGRLREHHQFGMECFGAREATADAELILVAYKLLSELGIKNLSVNINSIGCPNCRPKYHGMLRDYLAERYDGLCTTCKSRFERNPLRVLDCKEKGNPRIVRGLDYYTRTVFELITETKDGSLTVCGGGRYDHLVEQIGGPDLPAVGFGMGLERVLMLLDSEGVVIPEPSTYDVYITYMGDHRLEAFMLAERLRNAGLKADMDHCGRSLKDQLKYANKTGAPISATIGDEEAAAGAVKLKNMATREERTIALDRAAETAREMIG